MQIHLIEKENRFTCKCKTSQSWESGFWKVSTKVANSFFERGDIVGLRDAIPEWNHKKNGRLAEYVEKFSSVLKSKKNLVGSVSLKDKVIYVFFSGGVPSFHVFKRRGGSYFYIPFGERTPLDWFVGVTVIDNIEIINGKKSTPPKSKYSVQITNSDGANLGVKLNFNGSVLGESSDDQEAIDFYHSIKPKLSDLSRLEEYVTKKSLDRLGYYPEIKAGSEHWSRVLGGVESYALLEVVYFSLDIGPGAILIGGEKLSASTSFSDTKKNLKMIYLERKGNKFKVANLLYFPLQNRVVNPGRVIDERIFSKINSLVVDQKQNVLK